MMIWKLCSKTRDETSVIKARCAIKLTSIFLSKGTLLSGYDDFVEFTLIIIFVTCSVLINLRLQVDNGRCVTRCHLRNTVWLFTGIVTEKIV